MPTPRNTFPHHPRPTTLTLALLLLPALLHAAEVTPATTAATPPDPDRAALTEILALYEQAFNGADPQSLRARLDPEFSAVAIERVDLPDLAKLLDHWKQRRDYLGQGGGYLLTLTPKTFTIRADFALLSAAANHHIVPESASPLDLASLLTAAFRKTDGQWRLLRVHESIDPFDNPLLDWRFSKLILAAGIPAALTGLLVGVVATWCTIRYRAIRAKSRRASITPSES